MIINAAQSWCKLLSMEATIFTKFATWLKAERDNAGLTQRELAKLSHVHHSTIGKVEQELGPVTPEIAALITFVLLRSKPFEALSWVWSVARKEQIKVEQPSDAWIYQLAPHTVDATPAQIDLAIHMFISAIEAEKRRAAMPHDTKLPVG